MHFTASALSDLRMTEAILKIPTNRYPIVYSKTDPERETQLRISASQLECCRLLSLAELKLTAFNRPPYLAMVSRAQGAGLAFRGHSH